MNTQPLIPITTQSINDQLIQTVDARNLHVFLEVGDHFRNWVKGRIEQYGFIENQDFVSFAEKSAKGRPSREYHLTLDMAKELAMVERNEKGRKARQYFIQCERSLHDASNNLDQVITKAIGSAVPAVLEKLVPQLVDAKLASDARVAIVHGISAKELLDQEKVPSKGRRGLLLKATNGLSNHCLETGERIERCARTKTKLYPLHVAESWLKAQGRSLIKSHMDGIHGQLVLVFPTKESKSETSQAGDGL